MKVICFFFVSMTLTSSAIGQWIGFSKKQEIPVERRIYSFALANADEDHFRDLIALPFDALDQGLIFNGDGSSNFVAPHTFSKQELYRLLHVADLDSDGIDDLVISSYWGNGFRIYWGTKEGAYTEGNHYALTGHGKNIAIDDMNGDGHADIVALSGGSGQPITLHFFTGNGSRTMTPAGVFPSALHTDTRITITDKNMDGKKDVVVATSFPAFVIFYQQLGGAFQPHYWPNEFDPSQPFTSDYYVADFNNDSKPDLLAYFPYEGFRLYEGLQDTLFASSYQVFPTHQRLGRVFIKDLNGDGNNDILMENYTPEYEPTSLFYYALGKGDFTFEEPVAFDVGAPIERLLVDDFNSDGFPDVILYSSEQKLMTILNEGVLAGTEDQASNFTAYPNPFNHQLTLAFASYPAVVNIVDSQGRNTKQVLADGPLTLSTSEWSNGVYIVNIVRGNTTHHLKVVKQD